jgi:hypothetical protein
MIPVCNSEYKSLSVKEHDMQYWEATISQAFKGQL